MLDAGQSAHSIASTTGFNVSTITRLHSKEHSELQKSTGGHPLKLSPINIHHAVYLITSQKAENAVQVTKTLRNIINQPLSPSTVRLHLKKTGMKTVVKSKCPFLSARLCLCSQGLDCGWLEEGHMVWWDQDQSPRVRWTQMGMEKARWRAQ